MLKMLALQVTVLHLVHMNQKKNALSTPWPESIQWYSVADSGGGKGGAPPLAASNVFLRT